VDQPRVRMAWDVWTTGGVPQFLEEFRVVRPGGSIRWVSSSGTVIRDDAAAVVRLSILTRDITEDRAAHEAARLQGAAFHAAADAIVITNRAGVIEWVNPAFTQLTGYTSGEALGKNPRDLVKSGQHAQGLYTELWETILAGRTWHGEMINRRKDGTLYTEHQAITPIPNASGVITHFVAIKRDLTERLQLEAQLRQAQKMESVGQLAAGVAHEINTPVQFVSDSVHFVQEAVADLTELLTRYQAIQSAVLTGVPTVAAAAATEARQVEEAIDLAYLLEHTPKAIVRALDGLGRIASIVGSLKDFARADQKEMASADLNEAIRGTLAIARSEYKYVADVETEFGELPRVLCHVGELNQVMLNLIVNAAHAIGDIVQDTGTKGLITIRTRRENDDVVITVTDTGPGIPEPIRARIFDPFFTTKPIGRGSGQGLAIAWAIVVDKHRGRLTVDSTVGQGTTFAVRLPI
ncbi:MAG: PAS domain S-box protein, partial [Vicinamibacterales bacterium]